MENEDNIIELSSKPRKDTWLGFIDVRDKTLFPLQIVLFILALIEAYQAITNIFETPPADDPHIYSHLGSYMLAYAAGLMAISFRPARARGLLVLVSAAALGFLVTAVLDIARQRVNADQEIIHITKLIPPFVVWIIASRVIFAKSPKK